jgi:hypothetical protein
MQHSPETSKILFVVNPVSGGRKKINWETGIREYFTGSGSAAGDIDNGRWQ